MTYYRACVKMGNISEDSSDTPFIWGTVVSSYLQDEFGKPVSRPASIMIYGYTGVTPGRLHQCVLISRGIPGLFDMVHPDDVDEMLNVLGLKFKELPEPPVIEQEPISVDRGEARKKAREARKARKEMAAKLKTIATEETQKAMASEPAPDAASATEETQKAPETATATVGVIGDDDEPA